MEYSKHALSALVLSAALLAGHAMAQHERAAARPEAIEPAKPAPANRKTPPRRPVPQVIEPTPRIGTGPLRPSLAPAPPLPPAYAPAPGSPPPVQINRCDAGGCTDINGARYNSAVGNATVSPDGRLCNRSGTTLQCF